MYFLPDCSNPSYVVLSVPTSPSLHSSCHHLLPVLFAVWLSGLQIFQVDFLESCQRLRSLPQLTLQVTEMLQLSYIHFFPLPTFAVQRLIPGSILLLLFNFQKQEYNTVCNFVINIPVFIAADSDKIGLDCMGQTHSGQATGLTSLHKKW